MNRNLYLILGGMFFFSLAAQTMVAILVPLTAASMAASKTLIGLIVAVPAFVSLVTGLPCAVLSDTVGRRPMLVASSVMNIVAAITVAVSNGYLALVLGITLNGLGNSFWWGPALAYVTEASSPEDHARVQGYNGVVQGLGAFVGASLAGIVVDAAGFAVAFVMVALFGMVIALLVLPIQETVKRADSQPTFADILRGCQRAGRLLRTLTEIQMAAVIVLLQGIVIFSVGNSFLPLYVTTHIGYSPTLAGGLLSVRDLLGMIASSLFGLTVARFDLFHATLVSQGLGSLVLLLIPWSSSATMLFVLLAIKALDLA